MNLTLAIALACLAAWIVLLIVSPVVLGATNLLYAVSAVLFARRVMIGAPKFLS